MRRAPITAAVLSVVAANLDFPVGDAEKPDGGGWATQQEVSAFTPYAVITPLEGSPQEGSLRSPEQVWTLPYAVTSIGKTRSQCEELADLAREAIEAMKKEVVGDAKVMYVWSSVGMCRNFDNPRYYSQTDYMTLQVSF